LILINTRTEIMFRFLNFQSLRSAILETVGAKIVFVGFLEFKAHRARKKKKKLYCISYLRWTKLFWIDKELKQAKRWNNFLIVLNSPY